MSTLILVHGYHLLAPSWEEIVWGNPEKGVLGRASLALKKALELKMKSREVILFFGTGASQKDSLLEAVYTRDFALEAALGKDLKFFVDLFPYLNVKKELSALLKDAVLDTSSLNTKEEVSFALETARKKEVEEVILVSSSSHIARCLQNALSLTESLFLDFTSKVSVLVPLTSFAPAKETLILEPSHRTKNSADLLNSSDLLLQMRLLTKKALSLKDPDLLMQASLEAKALLAKWEERGI